MESLRVRQELNGWSRATNACACVIDQHDRYRCWAVRPIRDLCLAIIPTAVKTGWPTILPRYALSVSGSASTSGAKGESAPSRAN
jgi:hypothetical protein